MVTGAAGLLGCDVVSEFLSRGHSCLGCARRPVYNELQEHLQSGNYRYFPLDICCKEALFSLFLNYQPEAVIHCAAWRDAISAELPENRAAVFAVNANATRQLAELCNATGCKMIYISTDYVFDGSGTTPWPVECKTLFPLNVYGESKLEGERAIEDILSEFFIVRTSWLFGMHGKNFVNTMLQLGSTLDTLTVVDDQFGTPTYTKDLAILLADMADSNAYGYYHVSNSGGYISRFTFAKEVFRQAGIQIRLKPVHTASFPGDPLCRPLNGRLELSSLQETGFCMLPDWKNALSRYLRERRLYGENKN